MNNIKILREKSGITQSKLGELMGVSKQCVCNYEKNLSQPPFYRVRAAIDAVNKMGHNVNIDDVYRQHKSLQRLANAIIKINSFNLTLGNIAMPVNKNTLIELKDSHSLDEALRAFSRKHPIHILAPVVGCSENVLRNKLNPDQEFHKITLNETLLLSWHTADFSLFRAPLQMLSHDIHRTNEDSTQSNMLHLVLKSVSAAGNITSIFDKAYSDAHIDDIERTELIKANNDAIKLLQELNGSLAAKSAG